MLTIEADIYEYVRMSYVDKNILGPLVHMRYTARVGPTVTIILHITVCSTAVAVCYEDP